MKRTRRQTSGPSSGEGTKRRKRETTTASDGTPPAPEAEIHSGNGAAHGEITAGGGVEATQTQSSREAMAYRGPELHSHLQGKPLPLFYRRRKEQERERAKDKSNAQRKESDSQALKGRKRSDGESSAGGAPRGHSLLHSVRDTVGRPLLTRAAYEVLGLVGKGTFGIVYKGRCLETKQLVALKKVHLNNDKEGVPQTCIREIKILRALHHTNVIALLDIVTSDLSKYEQGKGSIFLVFEYMDHDLNGLLEMHSSTFTLAQVKSYVQQILLGLAHCHERGVIHRDIKASNMLVNNKGIVKLGDLGLAKLVDQKDISSRHLTNRVITLWYRPPEILLGSTSYTFAADMWSAGCILAELLNGKPIFKGQTEVEQLEKIYELCGTPTEQSWPEASMLDFHSFTAPKTVYQRTLKERLTHLRLATADGIDLIDRLLEVHPARRLSAKEALAHPFFLSAPLPARPLELPVYLEACHEMKAKQVRREKEKAKARAVQYATAGREK